MRGKGVRGKGYGRGGVGFYPLLSLILNSLLFLSQIMTRDHSTIRVNRTSDKCLVIIKKKKKMSILLLLLYICMWLKPRLVT